MYHWGLRDSGMGACTDGGGGIRVLHGEKDNVPFIPMGDRRCPRAAENTQGAAVPHHKLLPARDLGAPSASDNSTQEHLGSASMFLPHLEGMK